MTAIIDIIGRQILDSLAQVVAHKIPGAAAD